ncbi:MAG: D-glycero-beta-D-manno-heptose 1,7-bisphosphate 7-phosphatase [Mariprofundaceae bacterium]|nr:D-glycero-beta-D-manno-heptose 1,7-bisphosphate 7-phosphatase [Mariprofundaceae bacterium]
MTQTKLVLLDRDGVINYDSPDYILNADQWLPIPGSLQAIRRLKEAGIEVAICSNQSGLGRDMMNQHDFAGIQHKMMTAIAQAGGQIDYMAYCPHHPDDACACRKPKAGLLLEAMEAVKSDVSNDEVVMIGDSLRDIQAAHCAGVRSMLVGSGYGDAQKILSQAQLLDGSMMLYDNLAACVDVILGEVS